MIASILIFLLGSCVGSFLLVYIDRSIEGTDWVRGRSQCDKCGRNLAWYDLFPIFSYLYFAGKSSCCRTPLSYRYPLIELITGIIFVLFFHNIFYLVTALVLLVLFWADLYYQVVLMPIVWIGCITTLFHNPGYITGVIFFIFFWVLWKITKGRGMADGDMYVALYMGLLLGHPMGVVALFLSFILGAVVGVFLIVTGIRGRHDVVPFVPFMVVAIIITILSGNTITGFLGL